MDKKQIIISIIVPIYKVENYIEKCALSILRQNYSSYEIIFVDDCSPDNSCNKLEEVLKKYPECPYKIIHHGKNLGLAAARKSGVEVAQGEYILHVDSDDYLLPDTLESFAYLLQQNTQPDIILGNYVHIYPHKLVKYYRKVITDKECLVSALIERTEPSNIWNNLIRRSLYDDLDIPAINNGEDYVTMPRLVYKAHKIIYNSAITYAYTHLNSDSFQFKRSLRCNMLDRNNTYKFLLHYFQANHAPSTIINSIHYAVLNNNAVNLIYARTIEEVKEVSIDSFDLERFKNKIKNSYLIFLYLKERNRFKTLLVLGNIVRRFFLKK